jgi:hypothetical protein
MPKERVQITMLHRHCSLEAGHTYNLPKGPVVDFIIEKELGVLAKDFTGELKIGRQLPGVVLRRDDMTNRTKLTEENE